MKTHRVGQATVISFQDDEEMRSIGRLLVDAPDGHLRIAICPEHYGEGILDELIELSQEVDSLDSMAYGESSEGYQRPVLMEQGVEPLPKQALRQVCENSSPDQVVDWLLDIFGELADLSQEAGDRETASYCYAIVTQLSELGG